MGLDSKLMFRRPPMPAARWKTIPAFVIETRTNEGDWTRVPSSRSSRNGAIREAGRTIRKLLEVGYEASARLVEDGTMTVRDYL